VAIVKLALEKSIPMDCPMQMGWRESGKLIPNWRFSGITGEIEWIVDVYCGGFCFVAVGRASERCRTASAALRFLQTHLAARGVKLS